MSGVALCPGYEWQREELSVCLLLLLPLHGDHPTQLRQQQQPLGHVLVTHVWVVVPAHGSEEGTSQWEIILMSFTDI